MKCFIVALICIAAAVAAPTNDNNGRIIGGELAEDGQFPYLVGLFYNDQFWCGGSILDETTILTAATATLGTEASGFTVLVGTNQLDDEKALRYEVESFVYHEDFSAAVFGNDIAIFKLSKPIEFNDKVQPISLPTSNDEEIDVVVSGWGSIRNNETIPSNDLLYLNLKTITSLTCSFLLQREVTDYQVCTSNVETHGVCHRDGGNPLVDLNGHQVGILSLLVVPCGSGYPDLYTRVYTYLDWIEDNRH